MARIRALLGAGVRRSDYLKTSLWARVVPAEYVQAVLEAQGCNSQRTRRVPAVGEAHGCVALTLNLNPQAQCGVFIDCAARTILATHIDSYRACGWSVCKPQLKCMEASMLCLTDRGVDGSGCGRRARTPRAPKSHGPRRRNCCGKPFPHREPLPTAAEGPQALV
jgi:hypothetical protein